MNNTDGILRNQRSLLEKDFKYPNYITAFHLGVNGLGKCTLTSKDTPNYHNTHIDATFVLPQICHKKITYGNSQMTSKFFSWFP